MTTVVVLGLVALCLLAFGGTGTESGWASASVQNTADNSRTGTMAITHIYGGQTCSTTARTASVSCGPTLGTQAAAPAQSTDAITNNSSGAVTQTLTGASCGVVQLANSHQNSDPMLPRSGTTFAPTGGPSGVAGAGAVTFDSSGYATGVGAATAGGSPNPALLSLGTYSYFYGLGVWFQTTATSGRIFGLASSPSNSPASGSTTFERQLTLSAGKLNFATTGAATATSSAPYNDGVWHYVYVSLEADGSFLTGLLASYMTKVKIYVDGTQVASTTTPNSIGRPTGYWSIGGGGFTGSLSNFAVYNATNSPTSPPAAPYNSAAELWPLNDTGYATATATLPVAISDPCSKVNIAFSFSNPSASITNSLSGFANGSAQVVAAPAAGQTQALTISTSRSGNSDIAGLHLYVPLTFTYGMGAGWSTPMTWSADPLDVFWA